MNFKQTLKYFLVWQLLIIIITSFSPRFLALREPYLGGATQTYLTNPLLYSRANFDGVHYLNIADNGYGHTDQAFFPLYPTLIRYFSPLFHSQVKSGVFISSLSFFCGLIIFNKLIRLDHSSSVSFWTIVSLLIFPVSFFFTSVYTEGLFFLLIVSSFLCARKHWWLAAGILGALASYTRFVGIFLFPALIIEWWIQGRRRLDSLLPLFLIPIGLIAFSLFLDKTTGDPLGFIHVQKLFGQNRSEKIILLYQVFWRYVKMVATVDRTDLSYLTILLEFFTGLFFGAISLYSLFKQRLSYGIFTVALFIVPTLTGSLVSLPRYVLACFPVFIALGVWLNNHPKIRYKYLIISVGLLVLFLSEFVRGYWVS